MRTNRMNKIDILPYISGNHNTFQYRSICMRHLFIRQESMRPKHCVSLIFSSFLHAIHLWKCNQLFWATVLLYIASFTCIGCFLTTLMPAKFTNLSWNQQKSRRKNKSAGRNVHSSFSDQLWLHMTDTFYA